MSVMRQVQQSFSDFIYPPPHLRQQYALITVHTNATAVGILNKAAALFRLSPNSISAHYLSFFTRISHDLASTLEEIRLQDYGVIQLLARASGGVGSICERTDPLATCLDYGDRQTLFLANCGSIILSLHLVDKSRVVGEYGGNILHSSQADLSTSRYALLTKQI